MASPLQPLEQGSSNVIRVDFKISQGSKGIEDNHLEIILNGVPTVKHSPLGYYRRPSDKLLREVRFTTGFIQVWLDFDGVNKEISGSVAPVSSSAPERHSFSYPFDIEPYVDEFMFVGISLLNTRTIKTLPSNHYIMGWSMKMNGRARDFDLPKFFQFRDFSNQVSGGVEFECFPSRSDFPCLGCLTEYLRKTNCTAEQIQVVLEEQCQGQMSMLYLNVNATKTLT